MNFITCALNNGIFILKWYILLLLLLKIRDIFLKFRILTGNMTISSRKFTAVTLLTSGTLAWFFLLQVYLNDLLTPIIQDTYLVDICIIYCYWQSCIGIWYHIDVRLPAGIACIPVTAEACRIEFLYNIVKYKPQFVKVKLDI